MKNEFFARHASVILARYHKAVTRLKQSYLEAIIMKAIPAVLFALAITGVIGIGMLLIGGNALFNPNTVPVVSAAAADSSSATTKQAVAVSASNQQMADMQALIQQYQQREKQYQTQLNEAAQRLNQANQQLSQANQQINQANQSAQSYQQILSELQRRGIIRIDQDGNIFIRRGDFD
jgi:methyl-accepting chemotaxis protein